MLSTNENQICQYLNVRWVHREVRNHPFDILGCGDGPNQVIWFAIREYVDFVDDRGEHACFVFRNTPVALGLIGGTWTIIHDKNFLTAGEFKVIHDFPSPEDAIMFMVLEGGKYDENWSY